MFVTKLLKIHDTYWFWRYMYGFSKCSSWKPPVSKVSSDIFHHKALGSPMILWFRKMCHFLQIMTTKYWRQSCQADVFFLLLELYRSWVLTVMKTGMTDFGLKKSQLYQLCINIFILLCMHHTASIEFFRANILGGPRSVDQFIDNSS